jgi:hypothetical protein
MIASIYLIKTYYWSYQSVGIPDDVSIIPTQIFLRMIHTVPSLTSQGNLDSVDINEVSRRVVSDNPDVTG